MPQFTLTVVGNPNCGKTTLFNDLTGARQHTGNWPGVTVDRKEGRFDYQNHQFRLIDLPGTYALDLSALSVDETIAREYIMSGQADLVINIVDASNLERSLYLTTQLIEMRVPLLVVLNMMDVAKDRGYEIDLSKLGEQLGCPVIATVATRKKGVEELKAALLEYVQAPKIPERAIQYPEKIELALDELGALLHPVAERRGGDTRWLSLQLLEGESGDWRQGVGEETVRLADKHRQAIEEALNEDIDILIADSRYQLVHQISREVLRKTSQLERNISDKIDSVVLHRFLGIPIFLALMYLMFLFTINVGGAFIDVFDMLSGAIFVDGLGNVLSGGGAPEWLRVLVADGVGGGLQVVATFIPIIGFLYLFLSCLEDSGYMARAAFVMDRFMGALGLPGKAFVPLIVGFGCNVPAIMAARTLDRPRERIMTVMMAPFMSCGARLSVYALFAAAFFPVGGQNVVFLLYLIGILFAIMTAFLLKSTLLKGEAEPFLMELPTYHVPTLRGILLHTWEKLRGFLFSAGKIIVMMVLVINVLNSVGTDGSFGNEDSEKSVLSAIGRTITPAFAPIGIQEDNWPAVVGIFTGILAKEVVVGTLDAIYSRLDVQPTSEEADETFDFGTAVMAAITTVPVNLLDVLSNLTDPLGFNVLDSSGDMDRAAEEQEVSLGTFGAMQERFDGKIGAFAYLLFVLLYFPCASATAAVFRETNGRWTLFAVFWSTSLAYGAATVFYQSATFSRHPESSLAWIIGLLGLFALAVFAMWSYGQRQTSVKLSSEQT